MLSLTRLIDNPKDIPYWLKKKEVGIDGIGLKTRTTRVFFNGLTFQRTNTGCNDSQAFFDNSQKANEVLF